MRVTHILSALLILLVASCAGAPPDLPTAPPEPEPPVAPPAPDPPGPAAQVWISSSAREFYVGSRDRISVQARDANDRATHSDLAILSSSDESVIALSAPEVITMPGESGATTRDLTTVATTVGPGSAVLRTSLNGISDSITLNVVPLPELAPDATAGLAVDSFTIVEHRSACWFTCRIFIYAPILALRAGTAPVEILKIRFDVVTATTGWCGHGDLHLAAGSAAYVNDMTQYLWFNGLLAFSRDEPLPPGPAKATVIFRTEGAVKRIEATGAIQRDVLGPVFPPSPFTGFEWSCTLPSDW